VHRLIARLSVAVVCATAGLGAQAPEGARELTPTAIRDSLRALQSLDTHLRSNPRDAHAWHRRGMIAWALAIRDQVPPPVAGIEWQRYGRAADTSLRIAAHLAPDSVHYSLAVARYLSTFFGPFNRTASSMAHAETHAAALARGEARQIVASGRSGGRLEWRFFDGMTGFVNDASGSTSPLARTQAARTLAQQTRDLRRPELRAEDHALRAEAYFRDAVRADPTDVGAAVDLASFLSEFSRWSEVGAVGRELTLRRPDEPWGWLLTGLAAQRRTDYTQAAPALERGLSLLDAETRQRWDRLERVLPPEDTASFAALPVTERATRMTQFWRDADPLWSIPGDEPRTEFLARLVQSDIRLSVPDLGVRGTETDGAQVLVRWGPPPNRVSFGSRRVWTWTRDIDAKFLGVDALRFDPAFADSARLFMRQVPALWNNIRVAHVDSLPSQVARFRGRDGVDAVVAFRTNVRAVQRATEVAQPVQLHRWLLADTAIVGHDSTALSQDSVIAHVLSLPAAQHTLRVEVSASDAARAGRVVRGIDTRADAATGFARTGFGMSDILLASEISETATARRWEDYEALPLVGTASRAAGVSLIWETYEPRDSLRTSSLDVTVQLMPLDAQVSVRAAVVARLRDLVGASSERADGSSDVRFTATRAWAPVLVDQLALDLSTVPDGRYALRVIVADRHGARTVDRVVVFSVGP
jgi:hypothetical protein